MSEQNHTPGPWTFEPRLEHENGHCLGIFGPKGEAIVVTDSGVYPPTLADAHLIAAAPDLLAALKRAVALLDDTADQEPTLHLFASTSKFSHAAIDKAEGRS